MPDHASLDATDRRILAQLQVDARMPMPHLADLVGLSAPACYRRVRRLRQSGAIKREVALVAPRTMGWPLSMIVLITLEREGANTMRDLMRKLEAQPEIVDAWQITGEYDIAARIVARDMESYEDFSYRLFAADERVRTFVTLVVMREMEKPRPVGPARDWYAG